VIKCDLEPIKEYINVTGLEDKRTKAGRYHGSMFWDIPGFGSKKWVVAARIVVGEEIPPGLTGAEIAQRCVDFINTPPLRRKFQRRVLKPKYGKIALYRAQIKKEDPVVISALLIVETRKSKHFWGKGVVT
jgi:hypothetical protein